MGVRVLCVGIAVECLGREERLVLGCWGRVGRKHTLAWMLGHQRQLRGTIDSCVGVAEDEV